MLQSEMFSCSHLKALENAEQELASFTVKVNFGEGLVNYIQHLAFPDESAGIMRTYIVRDCRSSELVGYFALKAGLISLNEEKTASGVVFDTLPGVEIANFAVNNSYIEAHPDLKGIGSVIFGKFIRPIIDEVAERIGVKIIYIFALPDEKLLRLYQERYGFLRLSRFAEERLHKRLKPQYDEGCVFMYQLL